MMSLNNWGGLSHCKSVEVLKRRCRDNEFGGTDD